MKEKILEALKKLDPSADTQWTKEGEVNLVAFKFMLGGEAVTREQIEEVAPGFNRSNPVIAVQPFVAPVEPSIAPATIAEGSITSGDVEPEDSKGTTSLEMKMKVEMTLSDGLRALLHMNDARKPVGELSQEEVTQIHTESMEIRGHLIAIKQQILKMVEENDDYLHEVTAEFNRRRPVVHHHQMVHAAYMATMDSAKPVDKARPRAAPIYPSLKR